MCGDEASHHTNVGLKDGDGDVAVERHRVDDQTHAALELLDVTHHHQGVQGVDEGQREAETIIIVFIWKLFFLRGKYKDTRPGLFWTQKKI